MLSSGPMFHPLRPHSAQSQESLACRAGIGKMTVTLKQFGRRAAPVKPAQENCSSSLDDSAWSAPQGIREPDVCYIVSQPDCMSEIRIRMIFNYKTWRAPLASEASVNSLEKPLTAGNGRGCGTELPHGLRLTGAGSICFSASCTSDNASFVPSIASSSVSR